MAVVKNKLEDRFYKTVLSWDYFRLLTESKKMQNKDKNTGGGSAEGLKEVKNTYADVDEYINTFEPLLFEEVKAQIVQGKDEEEETAWELVMISECGEDNGFHQPTIMCGSNTSISQNDLLFLSNKKFGGAKPSSFAFALVEYRSNEQARLRLFLKGEVKAFNTDDVQICPRLKKMCTDVTTPKSKLHALKICSLSTIVREYVGLWSISSLPFKDVILTGADMDKKTEDRAWKLSVSQTEFIESNYNKSQLEAIYAGLSRKPFVLIQGPPGTGKTQTILGLLSAVLHASPARVLSNKGKLVKHGSDLPSHERYNHWDKASPWLNGINPRDLIMPTNGDDGFFPISGNELKPEVVNSIRKYRVRVLVCAPSNSALDEIVLRLLNTGIRDENGYVYNPKIVRIGLNPHHSVTGVSMDYLVEQKRSGVDFQAGDKRQGGVGNDRDSIRASILDEAVIVFSTLSFSGSSLFSKLNRCFDVVIIDEAAQAVETATLIPLANGCRQVFLVGDPVQLPATVISSVAEKHGYGMSLFKRFQRAGYPVQMLKTQYRMNPEIRSFPSKEFYDNALEDGPDVEVQTRRTWHKYRCLGPFCFFDIHEGKESKPQGSNSWVNHDEVDFVLALYCALVSRYPELKSSSRLAIISPYNQQVKLFKEKFRSTFGIESTKVVDINTVDGFQGREKDVAIFSCVRANEDRGIGFVADERRMNVGITRARSSVLVVGSASTLRRGDNNLTESAEKPNHWKNLIESAEKTKGFFSVSKPYLGFFSEDNLETMVVEESKQEEDPGEEVGYDMGAVTNAEDNMDWGDAGEDDLGGGEDD